MNAMEILKNIKDKRMTISSDLKGIDTLDTLGFSTEVTLFLRSLLEQRVAVDQQKPLVIFDCDQTLIQGDLGEVLLRYLWLNGMIKEVGVIEKQAIIEVFQEQSNVVLKTFAFALEDSVRYFGYLWDLYIYICQEKIEYGYLFAASCITHFTTDEQKNICLKVFQDHIRTQTAFENLKSSYQGIKDLTAIAQMGVFELQAYSDLLFNEKKELWSAIQPYQSQKKLVSILQSLGFEVGIISSSTQGMVDLMAQYFQVDQAHTIAVAFDQQNPIYPIPINNDKITACLHYFKRLPILMVGDSSYDLPLMEKSRYGLLIDYQKEKVRNKAIALNAFLQDYQSLEV
jgi:phosphoserine phosphatase